MLFGKNLICLSLLLSISCISTHAMENVSVSLKFKESQERQSSQYSRTTPTQSTIPNNPALSSTDTQTAKETTQKVPSLPTQSPAPQKPQTPTPGISEKKEPNPLPTKAPQETTPPKTAIPTATAEKIDQIVREEPAASTSEIIDATKFSCPGYLTVKAEIVPSLQQNKNYCGYYALFNAIQMLEGKDNLHMLHKEFKVFLKDKLEQSVQNGHPLNWRHVDELRSLIPTPMAETILVIEPLALVAACQKEVIKDFLRQVDGPDGMPGSDHIIPALKSFKENKDGQIAIVGFVGNDHWIAIHARKIGLDIRLTVADSLNSTECAAKIATFRKYILPFCCALADPFKEWPKVFTTEYLKELDAGGQKREEKNIQRSVEEAKIFAKENAQKQKTGPSNLTLIQETKSLSELAVQKACEKALSKSLRLSAAQSETLHSLVLAIEGIMNKAQELQELLEHKDKQDTTAIDNIVAELLKIKELTYAGQITFVGQLLDSNAYCGNQELETMLENLVEILQNLKNFYDQLRTKKSEEFSGTLKIIVPLYESIKQKLLDAIELSSLLLEFPISSVGGKHVLITKLRLGSTKKQVAKPAIITSDTTQVPKPNVITPNLPPIKTGNDTATVQTTGMTSTVDNKTIPQDAYPLHTAARTNKRKDIDALLQANDNPRNIDELNDQGLSPLHVAICNCNRDAVTTLLDQGADPNLYSREGRTALHYAVITEYPNMEIMEAVIDALLANRHGKNGADINATVYGNYWFASWRNFDFQGWTPLHFAAQRGNCEVVSLLIRKGADRNKLARNITPLYLASVNGHATAVELLLKNGAQINLGKNPLDLVISQGHVHVVKALLDNRGAINLEDKIFSPLEIAITFHKGGDKKNLEIIELLLNKGASHCSDYVLKHACREDQNIEITRLLLKYKIDTTKALRVSTEYIYNDNIVRLLLANGADIRSLSETDKRGHYCLRYPLHEAADAGNCMRMEALIETDRSKINQEDEHHVMPLHYAANNGHLPIVNALCKKLTIIDSATDFGLVPLHCASIGGYDDVMQVLLQYDQDREQHHTTINAQNIHGLTPLHAAIMTGKVKSALLLLAEGANPEILSHSQLPPLSYAFMNKKSHDYFLPTSTIESIVRQHSVASAREDDQSKIINIGKTFDTMPIQGDIVSSLQQVRGDEDLTSYCGYYALYNALALLNFDAKSWQNSFQLGENFGTFDKNDRQKFSRFFNWALSTIAAKRRMGQLGYLLTKELRNLVSIICPNEPIVVLEKNHLKTIADGIVKPEEAFDEHEQTKDDTEQKRIGNEQTRELELLRAFSGGKLDHIVIIAGIGTNVGHWITIHAHRSQEGKVLIKVADSLRLVEDWNHDQSLIVNNILPFYLALTSGIDQCRLTLNTLMQGELFEEYQPEEVSVRKEGDAIRPIGSNKLALLIEALQTHVESINRLKEAIGQLLIAIDRGYFDQHEKLLTNLRLERFKRTSDILVYGLLRSRLQLKPTDPYQERLTTLERLFFKNIQDTNDIDIYTSLKAIIQFEQFDRQQRLDFAEQLHKLITKLNTMEPLTCNLVRNLRNQSDTAGQEFFNAAAMRLDNEQLAFILEYAPEYIKGLIGTLSKDLSAAPRLLLYGTPGTGKTTLAQAIAQCCNRHFLMIRIASTGNKYQFSQEDHLDSINQYLEQYPDAVILLDEIDCVFTDKKENDKAAKSLCDRIKNAATMYPKAVVIATTNCDIQHMVDNTITRDESGKKEFPPALKSLFGQSVHKVDNPELAQRKAIIDYYCKRYSVRNTINLSEVDKQQLAKKTKKFSIRDLESMFAQAKQSLSATDGDQFIRQKLAELHGEQTTTTTAPVVGPQIIDKAAMDRARIVVCQSIITGQPWTKKVADCYHIAERTLHLASLVKGVFIDPIIQYRWRNQDIKRQTVWHDDEIKRHVAELQQAIQNQQTYHNTTHGIDQQIEYDKDTRTWRAIDNDQNGAGLVASIKRECPVIGTRPENYTYEWRDNALRRSGAIPLTHIFTKTDVHTPYHATTQSK